MIDYLSQHLWQTWAVIAVICLILELTAGDFFIMCFSIGAAFACGAAAVGLGFYAQLVFFAVFTLISLFLVRPVALRYFHRHDEGRVSNADALLGRHGKVVETIQAGRQRPKAMQISLKAATSLWSIAHQLSSQ